MSARVDEITKTYEAQRKVVDAAKNMLPTVEKATVLINNLGKRVRNLEERLSHHRKPAKNKERDAEIVSLNKAGKSSGQIEKLLAPRYPSLTASGIRSVISRDRKSADHGKA